MIDINDIIDIIGSTVNKHLVLHRSMKQHPKFKVYKIFEYNLYSLDTNSEKELLISKSYTYNTPSEDILKTWISTDKEYLSFLFNWLYSNGFNI